MRALARLLGGLAVITLVIGIGWAFGARNEDDAAGPTVLLVVGVVAAAGATALLVLAERRPDGLMVPRSQQALPAPMWWPPLLAAGIVAVVGGGWISAAVAALGAVTLVVALLGAVLQVRRRNEPGPGDRRTVRLARQVLGFGRRHAAAGDSGVSAVIEPVGRDGVRLVLVAADGTFGDLVVRDEATARAAASLAGADVGDEFSRELAARIRTGRYEWVRMAGSQLGGPRD